MITPEAEPDLLADLRGQASPVIEHLIELKRRVVISALAWLVAFIGCYTVVDDIYAFLVEPLAQSFAADGEQRRLIYTSLTETFMTYISLAFTSAIFVAFPVLATQFYLFLAPGLYKKEKRVLLPYLLLSPILFFAGAAMAYYVVMPTAWQFFISFEAPGGAGEMPIQLEAKVGEYLGLVTQIIFAFGLAFQLPIALTLAVRTGMTSTASLRKWRKYAVVVLLIAAAILTPPDVLSQISLFIPLYLLYELAIIACGVIEMKKEKAE
jgi:sec-independent protein translocase protein TatC